MSKEKQNIIPIKSTDNYLEVNLRKVKVALKRSLMDYEDKQRGFDETFDIYEYLSENLGEGFSEPTLRKWTNIHQNCFCNPDQLLLISKLINDYRPVKILITYLEFNSNL
jgi:hypothetical protein